MQPTLSKDDVLALVTELEEKATESAESNDSFFTELRSTLEEADDSAKWSTLEVRGTG